MNFTQKLNHSTEKNNSLLCVGLDSDLDKIPNHLKSAAHAIFEFNKELIDTTHDLVCAYKINIAFYSAYLKEEDLILTMEYIHKNYPNVPVILDAKRGDIGNTADCYVKEAFDIYRADALTVSPYLGFDSLQPFLNQKEKGIVILCRTSNPGAKDLQDLLVDGQPLYRFVAQKAIKEWNKNNNVLLVVGATYAEELAEIRALSNDVVFLLPGIGAQGGDVEAAVKSGMNSKGTGLVINSSRAIIFASKEKDFAKAARKVAEQTRDEINKFRTIN